MPAPPVVGQRRGENGPQEVLGHIDAEDLRHTTGDIDAAGEVTVQLDAVGQNAYEDHRAAVGAVLPDDGVDHHRRPVGNDHLFEIAPHGQLDTPVHHAPVHGTLG